MKKMFILTHFLFMCFGIYAHQASFFNFEMIKYHGCLIASEEPNEMIVLESGLLEGETVRLSIASSEGFVTIDLGDGTVLEKEVSTDVNVPTFMQFNSPVTQPTITIVGNITGIDCSSLKLSGLNCSLAKSLMVLKCDINMLSSLDVSQNYNLVRLYCNDNAIEELHLGDSSALKLLYCHENKISDLNLDNSGNLIELSCYRNRLKSLDVASCPNLVILNVSKNKLGKIDLSKNSLLEQLYCEGCNLDDLEVSANPNLSILYCGDNSLTSLDVSNLYKLLELNCKINEITDLNLSNNGELEELYCFTNKLISLDISSLLSLNTLSCGDNNLTSLDVRNNKQLVSLSCSYNNISDLQISGNTSIALIACDHNLLDRLLADGCENLKLIMADHNNLSVEGTDELIESLTMRNEGEDEGMIIFHNEEEDPSEDLNVCAIDAPDRALSKRWYMLNGEDMLPLGIGDVCLEAFSESSKLSIPSFMDKWYIYDMKGSLVGKGSMSGVNLNVLHKGTYVLLYYIDGIAKEVKFYNK